MKKNKRPIKYKKERVILSDILPFEIPVTFSNRHFYDFLTKNEIELIDHKITWNTSTPALNEIIRLLFDIKKPIVANETKLEDWGLKTIPFNYKISHKQNDFRQLTLIHPKSQLAITEFYEKYKQIIVHYCSLSPFSIRRAEKVAKFIYHKDKTHREKLSDNHEGGSIEESDKEYESLKTFFVYKNYSNIHKFYESYKYHRCEKKYNSLFKFDISKCFDSIYTHSISWALLNKEIVKDNIKLSTKTFGGKFDSLLQDLNYGETNGIIIGPEFSRIFAEIILQRIDRNIEAILREKEGLKHKVDYEIFRYVDDYFVFYNQDNTKDTILKHFRLELKEYKLYLNDAKTILYEKPIITEITIAKQKVVDLMNKYLVYNVESNQGTEEEIREGTIDASGKSGSIYVSSNRLITKFKTIIKETSIDYKDVLNYTLSLIEKKFSTIIKNYQKVLLESKAEKKFTQAVLEILDFTFFLYSVSPRVNTTIRLCRILRRLTEFLNTVPVINIDFKHLIFKKIYDNLYFTLHKNKSLEHAQVETLYLLIALGELGKEYWLDVEALRQYVCIEKDKDNKLYFKGTLNYFTIVVLLFYMKNKKRYTDIRIFLLDHVKQRYNDVGQNNISKCSELVFLLFDLLTCPYIDTNYKKELLSLHNVSDPALQDTIINYREFWFTKWSNFDFGKELDAKHSQEVY